jgi:hypothetical protein
VLQANVHAAPGDGHAPAPLPPAGAGQLFGLLQHVPFATQVPAQS